MSAIRLCAADEGRKWADASVSAAFVSRNSFAAGQAFTKARKIDHLSGSLAGASRHSGPAWLPSKT